MASHFVLRILDGSAELSRFAAEGGGAGPELVSAVQPSFNISSECVQRILDGFRIRTEDLRWLC